MYGELISGAASIGGALISSAAQQSMNAENIRNQNIWNQQTLNAQMAAHGQNTAFMEDQQGFNREERQYAERFNAQQAELARTFNSNEAAANRVWLQSMSSSAYQRAMADMKAAGLNPILAYQQGGASAPGASAAAGPAASIAGASSGMASTGSISPHTAARGEADTHLGRALGNIVNSAVDTAKTLQGIDLMKADERVRYEDLRKRGQDTELTIQQQYRTGQETRNATVEEKILEERLKQEKIRTGDMGRYGSERTPGTEERIYRSIQDWIESGSAPPAVKALIR